MAHKKFEFYMPASAAVVFDAFHYHCWRARWDSLVSDTRVQSGEPCPFVGAITDNKGAGTLKNLSMRTQFVTYDRPNVAAATMLGQSFPFTRWAASMRHRAIASEQSVLICTYTFEVGPSELRWIIGPVVVWIFNWQTRRRFGRLRNFLAQHAKEVENWQRSQADINGATE
jgi:hypothetical protein